MVANVMLPHGLQINRTLEGGTRYEMPTVSSDEFERDSMIYMNN